MENKTRKIVTASLLAALVCVATMAIKIPSPLKGYLNLGDSIVLTAGWSLSPAYGFLAAAIGSAFADIFSGYPIYAPATFLIKGIMALIALYSYKFLSKKIQTVPSKVLSGILAESFMILGYYVFEGFMYGFITSIVNIPANAIQGIAGIITAIVISRYVVVNR